MAWAGQGRAVSSPGRVGAGEPATEKGGSGSGRGQRDGRKDAENGRQRERKETRLRWRMQRAVGQEDAEAVAGRKEQARDGKATVQKIWRRNRRPWKPAVRRKLGKRRKTM